MQSNNNEHSLHLSEGEKGFSGLFHDQHEFLEKHAGRLKQQVTRSTLWTQEHAQEILSQILLIEEKLDRHHVMEEEILYPVMAQILGEPYLPVIIMKQEHQQLKKQLMQMKQELPYCVGNPELPILFRVLVHDFIRILSEHIHKEGKLLFPMADYVMTPEQKERVFAALLRYRPE